MRLLFLCAVLTEVPEKEKMYECLSKAAAVQQEHHYLRQIRADALYQSGHAIWREKLVDKIIILSPT